LDFTKVLNDHLQWNKARVSLLANMVIALLKVRTVSLPDIASALPGKAKTESKYKQLQRFFRIFEMSMSSVSIMVAAIIPNSNECWTLSIDRTNWKLGKANINILCVGICYKGICFPIVWIPLDKRGNSSTAERISIIEKFILLFGKSKIKCLTADREFIGFKWFTYLLTQGIQFRIRVKENFTVTSSKGREAPIKALFRNLRQGEVRVLSRPRLICGVRVFIIGQKLPSGKYLILVTDSNPETAMDDYRLRWEIETLFACLKTRGFNFESTHLTKLDRIEKLVAVLAITFSWCHITGEWLHEQTPIKIKKHGRRAVSIFRYGLNLLREIVFNLNDNKRKYNQVVRLLSIRLDNAALNSG
jgi:hypothetical protein